MIIRGFSLFSTFFLCHTSLFLLDSWTIMNEWTNEWLTHNYYWSFRSYCILGFVYWKDWGAYDLYSPPSTASIEEGMTDNFFQSNRMKSSLNQSSKVRQERFSSCFRSLSSVIDCNTRHWRLYFSCEVSSSDDICVDSEGLVLPVPSFHFDHLSSSLPSFSHVKTLNQILDHSNNKSSHSQETLPWFSANKSLTLVK